jgi:hypothetical protein
MMKSVGAADNNTVRKAYLFYYSGQLFPAIPTCIWAQKEGIVAAPLLPRARNASKLLRSEVKRHTLGEYRDVDL